MKTQLTTSTLAQFSLPLNQLHATESWVGGGTGNKASTERTLETHSMHIHPL